MKIQCDVCERQQATVFCSADEAALCPPCDRRVHHANKLASKHLRFSLIPPTSSPPPLCDICQDRRAFLFCKEDRAILCMECDFPIHTTSEHTRGHSRFLFTGLKLSSSSSVYSASASVSDASVNTASPSPSNPSVICSDALALTRSPLSSSATTSYQAPCYNNNSNQFPFQMGSDQEGSISTSTDCNVADYYTTSSEVMPVGISSSDWQMDDLLYSSSPSHFFASKSTDYTLSSGAQQADSKHGYQYL